MAQPGFVSFVIRTGSTNIAEMTMPHTTSIEITIFDVSISASIGGMPNK